MLSSFESPRDLHTLPIPCEAMNRPESAPHKTTSFEEQSAQHKIYPC
jgi:hypothetical protein